MLFFAGHKNWGGSLHFGVPIIAFDCNFNRSTTEGKALFFSDARSLWQTLGMLTEDELDDIGKKMVKIAQRRYTWDKVAEQYFGIFNKIYNNH